MSESMNTFFHFFHKFESRIAVAIKNIDHNVAIPTAPTVLPHLDNGIYIYIFLHSLEPNAFPLAHLTIPANVENEKLQNLQQLINALDQYVEENNLFTAQKNMQRFSIEALSRANASEWKKLLSYFLLALIFSSHREEIIEKILALEESDQNLIMQIVNDMKENLIDAPGAKGGKDTLNDSLDELLDELNESNLDVTGDLHDDLSLDEEQLSAQLRSSTGTTTTSSTIGTPTSVRSHNKLLQSELSSLKSFYEEEKRLLVVSYEKNIGSLKENNESETRKLMKDMELLRKENERMKDEMKTRLEETELLTKEVKELKSKLKSYTTNNAKSALQSNSETQKLIEKMTEDEVKFQREKHYLELNNEKLVAENRSLTDEVSLMKEKITQLSSMEAKLKNANHRLEMANDYKMSMENLEELSTKQQEIITKLTAKVEKRKEMKAFYLKSKDEINSINNELLITRAKSDSYEKQMKEMMAKSFSLEDNYSQLQKKYTILNEEMKALDKNDPQIARASNIKELLSEDGNSRFQKNLSDEFNDSADGTSSAHRSAFESLSNASEANMASPVKTYEKLCLNFNDNEASPEKPIATSISAASAEVVAAANNKITKLENELKAMEGERKKFLVESVKWEEDRKKMQMELSQLKMQNTEHELLLKEFAIEKKEEAYQFECERRLMSSAFHSLGSEYVMHLQSHLSTQQKSSRPSSSGAGSSSSSDKENERNIDNLNQSWLKTQRLKISNGI